MRYEKGVQEDRCHQEDQDAGRLHDLPETEQLPLVLDSGNSNCGGSLRTAIFIVL